MAGALLTIALIAGTGAASASVPGLRAVRYRGYTVRVPHSWPVFDLARSPRTCVRFDRHAVYVGIPGPNQACPAGVTGRTEAILLEPLAAAAARESGGAATSFVVDPDGVRVVATWSRDRQLIARALGRAVLPAPAAPTAPARAARAARVTPHATDPVYEGLGFDACSAPSPQTMSDWLASPYRAIGIYIGGANSACAQPNLTPTWVSMQTAAGWSLIPTYVGLQAPSNECGCAAITPSQAAAQGTAAAEDAVTDAQSLGLGTGSPIYDDMESYQRTATNTTAVLAFLAAWTTQLHAEGYLSGVYSSSDSGMTDLASQYGTTYPEPDDIWTANWNNQPDTTDPNVPVADWSNNQRLHQYAGGHNETYGGAKINIDNDYLDGATVNTSTAPVTAPPPTLSVSPAVSGATTVQASWSGGTGLAFWTVLGGASADPTTMTALATVPVSGATTAITIPDQDAFFAVEALGSSQQVLATSAAVDTPAHIALYGHSAFVSTANGVGGLVASCYPGTACHVATTITVGRTVIARTGTERLGAGGILYFKLTPRGRTMLAQARGHRLAVKVTAAGSPGGTSTMPLNLIPFTTSGGTAKRSATQSAGLQIVGLTDYVSGGGWAGILANCTSPTPCSVATRLTVGRTVIARTGGERIGANELGYLVFPLTAAGRAMLARATGNQLLANLTISAGSSTASAKIALVRFS